MIHAEDVVRAAILCAENDKANGQIFNVTDGEVHTLKEIVEAISKALNKKPPKIKIPLGLVKPAVGLGEDVLKIIGKNMNLRNMLEKLNEDMAVKGDKIQRELDFKPKYNLEDGWKEAIRHSK